jgi:esterase/lipase superfamily enzyme
LGFKYPELFGTVVVSAGAVGYGKERPDDDTYNDEYPEEQPQRLAEKNADKLRGRTLIRISVGAKDYLLPVNKDLHDLLTRLKIEHEYELVSDVPHSWAVFYKKLGTKGFEFHRKALEPVVKSQ